MYRVVCNSYDNFITGQPSGYRTNVIKFLNLIKDVKLYEEHKKTETEEYKLLSDFLYRLKACRKCCTILDELAARGIEGKYYNLISDSDLAEQHKIFHMFLNLVYWK